ncbi:inositol monophosphatase family protein [Staphylococcus massiliensis]|uniref:Inositol monophosphatase n=1 Tax=Staphylococcus massiliensis S46 TaxID=1229783 RepID=K9ASG0_9STAP|nr:inositol monophosphatase family protein [Staphylococcus massiliensis]EKU48986.1 inositol monophosphatase [Staphylococcus massiliensis S46]MCG3399427.1 inositol monophosphatase family protein [Staphylococcus massiliensis]MCG3402473.1 inositol monophosphatase family protein [Staphylococcus massiliensis]MCG3411563.1 inositol monophosphatase family protein [Staphylococcus massiliensis]PNZ98336.1 inositol monophosphatase family protein [Staphylococcus massiliensis CCUG 55927]
MVTHEALLEIDEMVRAWLRDLDTQIPSLMNQMDTDTKNNRFDLVTNVDKTLQSSFQSFLEQSFDHHKLIGEEKDNSEIDGKEGHVWIMDPIDGTANLVKQNDDFCVILGYFIDGKPMLSYIYDYPRHKIYKAIRDSGAYVNNKRITPPEPLPLKDAVISFNAEVMPEETTRRLFDASFGFRFIGSCGLDSVRVINGQFGAHVNTNPSAWDIAAQHLFAELLGLKMTTLDNEEIDYTKGGAFIISNPGCHEDMLALLNQSPGYRR